MEHSTLALALINYYQNIQQQNRIDGREKQRGAQNVSRNYSEFKYENFRCTKKLYFLTLQRFCN